MVRAFTASRLPGPTPPGSLCLEVMAQNQYSTQSDLLSLLKRTNAVYFSNDLDLTTRGNLGRNPRKSGHDSVRRFNEPHYSEMRA